MESESTQYPNLANKYLLLSKLGHGATSKVYLARSTENNTEYAAKILKKATSRFQEEMTLLQKISHPNIINIKDGGVAGTYKNAVMGAEHPYIILELAQKGNLMDYVYLPSEGFAEKYARLIMKKILEGLRACHAAGVTHRDMKMENVMLDGDFNPKIADFGFAALMKGEENDDLLRTPVGTKRYAAPEIFLGRAYEGTKIDIFSTGVLLFTLVSCKFGFGCAKKSDQYYRKIMAKLHKSYWNDLEGKVPKLSEELKKLFVKMVAFNPKERPSITEIFEDPWMQGEFATEEELKAEFERRYKIVLEKNENEGIFSEDEDDSNQRGEGDFEYFNIDLKRLE